MASGAHHLARWQDVALGAVADRVGGAVSCGGTQASTERVPEGVLIATIRCLICNNDALLTYVNTGLNKGLSNRAIVSGLMAAGGKLDPEVVGRHKNNHWTKPKEPGAPEPTKRDVAIMLADRVAAQIARTDVVTDEETGITYDPLLHKDLAPGLTLGLKAQQILDKRQQEKNKLGLAAGALGFQMYLAGLGRETDPPELEDGLTIDGEAVELDETA